MVTLFAAVRFELGCFLALCAGLLSRVLTSGNGHTLPGRVLLLLAPDALGRLAKRHHLVLVSGTNGKTTTTKLLVAALSGGPGSVVTNADGANLTSGVVTTLLRARRKASTWAVLEADEVALEPLLAQARPEMVVLLNLSRDQLDRTSEVGGHVRRWREALLAERDVVIVANSDDALIVAAVLGARPDAQGVVWVAAGKPFRDDSVLCPTCGSPWDSYASPWECTCCGMAQPRATWQLAVGSVMTVGGEGFELNLALPGRANAANAVMACAAAHHLGTSILLALGRMRTVDEVEGRYARFAVGIHSVRLLLAKNPAGWGEALDQLDQSSSPVVIAVNARAADGVDPSWLWDVDFEQLQGRRVVVCAERAWDVAVRLLYADVPHQVFPDVLSAVDSLPPGSCVVVSNYTAFQAARRALSAG